jgi:lysophospholipase L1-like esterase
MSRKTLSIASVLLVVLFGCSQPKPQPIQRVAPATPQAAPRPVAKVPPSLSGSLLAGSHRIVFLGDSITYSGQYVDDLSLIVRHLAGDNAFEFLDLGLPSETVSGLSEPGHAHDSFPRPNLHDRLDRLLFVTKPDLVIACYGMNDGIYYPLDPVKFQKYQRGIQLLREKVLKANARLILITPPTFDPVPIQHRTLPAGLSEYRQPYVGYNDVLDRYSEWLLDQRTNGWAVIDAHFFMNNYLKQQRAKNPNFLLASDGVHLDDTGHWLMAQAILHGLKVPTLNSSAAVDFVTARSAGLGDTKDFRKQNGELEFVWTTRPPVSLPGFRLESAFRRATMTYPPHGEIHSLSVRRAEGATYRLFAEDQLLATASREQLAAGIDTRQYPSLITTDRGRHILQLLHSRNRIMSDAWLTFVGHKRPGMPKGLGVKEAEAEAVSLDRQIEDLSRPVELHIRLLPLPASR